MLQIIFYHKSYRWNGQMNNRVWVLLYCLYICMNQSKHIFAKQDLSNFITSSETSRRFRFFMLRIMTTVLSPAILTTNQLSLFNLPTTSPSCPPRSEVRSAARFITLSWPASTVDFSAKFAPL